MTSYKLEVIADSEAPTILTRRKLRAARALVFDAFTQPEYIVRWMGPASSQWVACESDLRVGGSYRWVQRTPAGEEFAFAGEFKEVVRPDRLVRTFVFEPMPEHVAVETLIFEEHEGITTVTATTVHNTMEGRDGHLAAKVDDGMAESYERLETLLSSLTAGAAR